MFAKQTARNNSEHRSSTVDWEQGSTLRHSQILSRLDDRTMNDKLENNHVNLLDGVSRPFLAYGAAKKSQHMIYLKKNETMKSLQTWAPSLPSCTN